MGDQTQAPPYRRSPHDGNQDLVSFKDTHQYFDDLLELTVFCIKTNYYVTQRPLQMHWSVTLCQAIYLMATESKTKSWFLVLLWTQHQRWRHLWSDMWHRMTVALGCHSYDIDYEYTTLFHSLDFMHVNNQNADNGLQLRSKWHFQRHDLTYAKGLPWW